MLEFDDTRKCYGYPDGQGGVVYGDPLEIDERLEIFANGDVSGLILKAFPKEETLVVPTYDEQGNVTGQAPKINKDGELETWQPIPSTENREKFYAMIGHAFQVTLFDRSTGTGYTRAMLRWLWKDFMDWLDGAKKKPDSSPTSLAPTEEASSTSSEDQDQEPAKLAA